MSLPAIYSILRKLKNRAGITNEISNPHSFRHSFAIRKINAGYDLPTVSAWLGHTDPSFTAKVYIIQREDELRAKFFN